jgi:hypothetical protein
MTLQIAFIKFDSGAGSFVKHNASIVNLHGIEERSVPSHIENFHHDVVLPSGRKMRDAVSDIGTGYNRAIERCSHICHDARASKTGVVRSDLYDIRRPILK